MQRADEREQTLKALPTFHTIGWAEKDWNQNESLASVRLTLER